MHSRMRGHSSSYTLLFLAALILFAHAASVYADNPSQGPYDPPTDAKTSKESTKSSDSTVNSDKGGKSDTKEEGCTASAIKEAQQNDDGEFLSKCAAKKGKVTAKDKDGKVTFECVKGEDCDARLQEMQDVMKSGGSVSYQPPGSDNGVQIKTQPNPSRTDQFNAILDSYDPANQARNAEIAVQNKLDDRAFQEKGSLLPGGLNGEGYANMFTKEAKTNFPQQNYRMVEGALSDWGGLRAHMERAGLADNSWSMENSLQNLRSYVESQGGSLNLGGGNTFSFESNSPTFSMSPASARAVDFGGNKAGTAFNSPNQFFQNNVFASQQPSNVTYQSLEGLQGVLGTNAVNVVGPDGKQLVWNPFTGSFEPLLDPTRLAPAIDPKTISFTPVADVTAASIEQAFAGLDSGEKTFQELAGVAAFPIAPSESTDVPGTVLTNLTPEERAVVLPTFGQAVSAWSEGKIDNLEFARQIGQNLAESSRAIFQRFGFAQSLPDGTVLSAPDAESGIVYRGIQGGDINPISSANASQSRGAVPILINDTSAASTLAKEVVYADASLRGADGKTLGQLFTEKGGAPLTLADVQGKGYTVGYFEAVHPTDAAQTVGRDIDGRKDLGSVVEAMRTTEGQSAGETVRSLVFYDAQPKDLKTSDSGTSLGADVAQAPPSSSVPVPTPGSTDAGAGPTPTAFSEGSKPLAATIQELWKDIANAEPPKAELPVVPGTIVDGENAGHIPSFGKQVADALKTTLKELNPFGINEAQAAAGAKTRFGIKALDAAPDNWVSKNLRDILAPQGCSARDHSCYTSPVADAEAYFSKLIGQPEYKDGCQPLTVRCVIVGKWVSDDSAWRAKVGARAVKINPEGHANDVVNNMREFGVDVSLDTVLDLSNQETRLALAKAMSKREGADPYADNILEQGYQRAVARFGGTAPAPTLSGGENDILYRSLSGKDLAAAERNGIDAVAQRLRDMGYNVEVVERKGVYKVTRPGEQPAAPFEGIVTHSTGDEKNSAELYVREPQNRGLFKTAYQAGIDCDEKSCKITLARSEDKYPTATRDNHVSLTSSRRPDAPNPDLSNSNTIGVALPGGAGRELRDSENQAAGDLAREFSREFGITRVTAHGVEDYKDAPGLEGVALRDAMQAAIAGEGGAPAAVARLPGGAAASGGAVGAAGRSGPDRPVLYDVASYNWDKFENVFQDPVNAARLAFGFGEGEGQAAQTQQTTPSRLPFTGYNASLGNPRPLETIQAGQIVEYEPKNLKDPAGYANGIRARGGYAESYFVGGNCYKGSDCSTAEAAGARAESSPDWGKEKRIMDMSGRAGQERLEKAFREALANGANFVRIDNMDGRTPAEIKVMTEVFARVDAEMRAEGSIPADRVTGITAHNSMPVWRDLLASGEAKVTPVLFRLENPTQNAYETQIGGELSRQYNVPFVGVEFEKGIGYNLSSARLDEVLKTQGVHSVVVYSNERNYEDRGDVRGGTSDVVTIPGGTQNSAQSGIGRGQDLVLQEGLSYDKPQTPQQVASRVGLFQDGGLLWEVARETIRNGFDSIVTDVDPGELSFDRFAMEGADTRVVFDDNPTGQLVTVDTRGGVQASSRYVDDTTARLQDQVQKSIESGALPQGSEIVSREEALRRAAELPNANRGIASFGQTGKTTGELASDTINATDARQFVVTPDGKFYALGQEVAKTELPTKDGIQAVADRMKGVFGCDNRGCLSPVSYAGNGASLPEDVRNIMQNKFGLGGASNPNGKIAAVTIAAFAGACEMDPADCQGVYINSAQRNTSGVGSARHTSNESPRAFDLQGFRDNDQKVRFLTRMAAIGEAMGPEIKANVGQGGNVTHIDFNGSEVSAGGGWAWNYPGGQSSAQAALHSAVQSGRLSDSFITSTLGANLSAAAPQATLQPVVGGGDTVALPLSSAKGYAEVIAMVYGPPTPESQGTAVQRIDTIARVDPSVPVNQITRFDPNTGRIYTIPAPTPEASPQTKSGPAAPWSPRGGNGNGSGGSGPSPFEQIAQSLGNMFGGGQGGQGGGQGGGKGGGQGAAPSGSAPSIGVPTTPTTATPAVAAATPAVLRFSCEPNALLKEGVTTVAWACGNNGTSKGTGFDTRGLPSGSMQIPVATTTTFNLACYAGGALAGERQCTVALLKPKVVIVAVPSTVERGGSVRIGWITSQTKNCSFYGPGTILQGGGPHGTMEVKNLQASTRFKLACGTAAGVFETPLIVEVKGYSGPIVDAEVPAESVSAASSAKSAVENSGAIGGGGDTATFDGGTNNAASVSTSSEGKFTATDASGNAVSLCDPAVGLFKFTQCLLGN